MKSNYTRNNSLPSDRFNNVVKHGCRSEGLKYLTRNSLYDVSMLGSQLDKTKTSLNLIYPYFLAERNHQPTPEQLALTSQEHFEETSTEK